MRDRLNYRALIAGTTARASSAFASPPITEGKPFARVTIRSPMKRRVSRGIVQCELSRKQGETGTRAGVSAKRRMRDGAQLRRDARSTIRQPGDKIYDFLIMFRRTCRTRGVAPCELTLKVVRASRVGCAWLGTIVVDEQKEHANTTKT